ncbi:hypothetical protein K1719_014314 [Acacia pycnantha]|nr:hypothetical protein K1719_014314 [Acacia pycnantha]
MKPFRRTLVVKLLGRQPSYGFMVKKLKQIWERKGQIDIFDLENDFYLVNFQRMEDYMEALIGGPWVISDAYLSVARWKPDFNPKNERIVSVVAWVRFPDLPAPLFDKKFLLNLGNSIGKAIRLDIHTAQRTRGRFARMCVELDLNKPLVPEFNVEGKTLSVVYESLGQICNSCGRVGHMKEGCEAFHRKLNAGGMAVDEPELKGDNTKEKESEEGLWKTVQRARRPRRQEVEVQNKQGGSRFSVLREEAGVTEHLHNENSGLRKEQRGAVVEKVLGKEVPLKQSKKGNYGGESGQSKDRETSKQRSKGGTGKEVPKEKGIQERGELRSINGGNSREGITENTYNHDVIMEVPESNMELYERQGVHTELKENLQPGAGKVVVSLKSDVGTRILQDVSNSVDVSGSAQMCMDEASPMESKRLRLWELLSNLATDIHTPWILGGDFNEIKTPREQKGGGRVNDSRCKRFNDWIEECSLIDLEAQGPFFTWKGPKWEGLDRVYKRLDRCLCSLSWFEQFADAEICVLPRLCSDHHPLLGRLARQHKDKRQRTFKYEAMWKSHELFNSVLKRSWRCSGEAHTKLAALQLDLTEWNKEVFGKLEGRKRRLYNRLNGIQKSLELASKYHWRRVAVESDSSVVIKLLNEAQAGDEMMLVRLIRKTVQNFNDVTFEHVYRESNSCADALAKHSLLLHEGRVDFDNPPTNTTNPEDLLPFDPEIERTILTARRVVSLSHRINTELDTELNSDCDHSDCVHSVALSDCGSDSISDSLFVFTDSNSNSANSDIMAEGQEDRPTLKELGAPDVSAPLSI